MRPRPGPGRRPRLRPRTATRTKIKAAAGTSNGGGASGDVDAEFPSISGADTRVCERDCVGAAVWNQLETVADVVALSPRLQAAPGLPGAVSGPQNQPRSWIRSPDSVCAGRRRHERRDHRRRRHGRPRQVVDGDRPSLSLFLHLRILQLAEAARRRACFRCRNRTSRIPFTAVPEAEVAGENRLPHVPVDLENLRAALGLAVELKDESRVGLGADVEVQLEIGAGSDRGPAVVDEAGTIGFKNSLEIQVQRNASQKLITTAASTAARRGAATTVNLELETRGFVGQLLQLRLVESKRSVDPGVDGGGVGGWDVVGELRGEAFELEFGEEREMGFLREIQG